MDDLLNREQNGWENRWTWLVHLHLSNEQRVATEIALLVATEPNEGAAAHLVEIWVKIAVAHWVDGFVGRNRAHDEVVRLLVWDVVGAALAHVEWDTLVVMLLDQPERRRNLFTATLYRNLTSNAGLLLEVSRLFVTAPSVIAAADALKAWCEKQLADWIDLVAAGRQGHALVHQVFSELVYNTYTLIFWDHVARAFRPMY